MPDDTQRFLDVALAAVKKSELIFLKSFGNVSGIEEKIDGGIHRSPVTMADKEIEKIITSHLLEAFPDHSISGEEFPVTQNTSKYTWYIDPIDGTINYIRGLSSASISLALWEGNQPLVAVIHDPVNSDTYSAIRGKGAFMNGQKLFASSVRALSDAIGHMGRAKALADDPGLQRVARLAYKGREFGGAALELCAMAEGKLDFYISERTKIFDNAAGMLILTEAGGRVSDWSGGPYLPESKNIVASNGLIHDELLKELQG